MPNQSPPSHAAYNALKDDAAKNRLLLQWLEDDDARAGLFKLITNEFKGCFDFPSRAAPPEPCCVDNDHPRPAPTVGHRTVRILTKQKLIEQALEDGGLEYSSRPYGDLGGGNFTLALDPTATDAAVNGEAAQNAQLAAMRESFPPQTCALLPRIARTACADAAIISLRGQEFDLARYAEQAALRFCQYLFGYATKDFRLLEEALRASYLALVYQVLGRHFSTEPLLIRDAQLKMGKLLTRSAELIDAYARDDEDALMGCELPGSLASLHPVLQKLGKSNGPLNGEQRAIVAIGAAAGTVGNVQAAVCIAVKAILADFALVKEARSLALSTIDLLDQPSQDHPAWQALLAPLLNRNPPIAFLPRVQIEPGTAGAPTVYRDVLLALGGTGPEQNADLIWGEPGRHACFGKYVAWPLIIETVRHVMALPGLAERLDPLDASPIGLKKRWGFLCESYPLWHRRDRRVAQSSLNVHMRIKAPVEANAERLRQVIRSGAPRIDEVLRESRHVHFAWFELIERDTVLVLHTVYDGDFAAYVQHFALRVGDVFDALFESIEDAPPSPVNKFPNEFVALIRRYDRGPAMGYFFSAYPRSETAAIVRRERNGQ